MSHVKNIKFIGGAVRQSSNWRRRRQKKC